MIGILIVMGIYFTYRMNEELKKCFTIELTEDEY